MPASPMPVSPTSGPLRAQRDKTWRDRLRATNIVEGRNVMVALTRRAVLSGLSAAAVLRPERAFAAWPERNISLIHGLTAGGGRDVSARAIAQGLSRNHGQTTG